MSSLAQRISDLAAAIGADIKAINAARAGYGQEMGYAETTTTFSSTNTVAYSVAAGVIIPSLSVTVTGTGRPVDIEFCSQVRHSVASTIVAVNLVQDGAARGELYGTASPSTTQNVILIVRKRLIIANGVTTTFQIGTYIAAAGTGTYAASASIPMWLSVVGR